MPLFDLRLMTLFAFGLAWFSSLDCSFGQASKQRDYWTARRALEADFQAEIDRMVRQCQTQDLDAAARTIEKFAIQRDPKRQYIFLAPENIVEADRFPNLPDKIKSELTIALNQHADQLLELAKTEATNERGAWSYQLLHEILFLVPDHREVRKILGHREIGSDEKTWRVKSDRLRVKRSTRAEKELGWPARSYWVGSTTHFQIVSTAGEDATIQLAQRLERWHDVWRQVFFDYYNSGKNLKRWFAGNGKPTPSGRKFKVVFFADRNEYVSTLKEAIPGIEASTGYYNDSAKKSYFFASDDKSIHDTWRHELTHQMFQESKRSIQSPFRDGYLWLGEGIAMYFESLVDHGNYLVLGGFDARRLQYARLRRMKEQFRIPVEQLSRMNMVEFQSLTDVAKVYSQSAGMTQMLMTTQSGSYQTSLINFLAALYGGKAKSQSLSDAIDLTYEDMEKEYDQFLRIVPEELVYFDRSAGHDELALIGVRFSDAHLEIFNPNESIDWLDLSGSDIRGKRLGMLESCQSINQLFCTGARIDAGSIRILAKLPVKEIDMSGTRLDDTQLKELSGNRSIQSLNLVGTQVTKRGLQRLMQDRPDLTLVQQAR